MVGIKEKIKLVLIIATVFLFCGCANVLNFNKSTSDSKSPAVENVKYSKEIVELNHVVQQNSKSPKAKKAHLKLAELHSDHNNRRRNYHKALKHLEAYIILEDSAADNETLDWLAVLKKIDRLSKEMAQAQNKLKKSKKATLALKKSNRKLTREEIKLREKNRKLEETNQKLHKTIEMLKNLDRRLEEKRRSFNN